MNRGWGFAPRRRGTWNLAEPSSVLLWWLGIGWSSVAAVTDAAAGRHVILSGLVLLGPVSVLYTGRWLRTACAGAWAIVLVIVLGIHSRRKGVICAASRFSTPEDHRDACPFH